MSYSDEFAARSSYLPPSTNVASHNPRSLPPKYTKRIKSSEVVQGKIYWLPHKSELPKNAVLGVLGESTIRDGIYNHPIVVISRPAGMGNTAHFYIITSFGGKEFDEIFSDSSISHESRRSQYLPIAPTPNHPDKNSIESKDWFPTLELAGGKSLRKNSYVNFRQVYKIDCTLLRPYFHPSISIAKNYQFTEASVENMLEKGWIQLAYMAGTQYQPSEPPRSLTMYTRTRHMDEETKPLRLQTSYPGCTKPIHRGCVNGDVRVPKFGNGDKDIIAFFESYKRITTRD